MDDRIILGLTVSLFLSVYVTAAALAVTIGYLIKKGIDVYKRQMDTLRLTLYYALDKLEAAGSDYLVQVYDLSLIHI